MMLLVQYDPLFFELFLLNLFKWILYNQEIFLLLKYLILTGINIRNFSKDLDVFKIKPLNQESSSLLKTCFDIHEALHLRDQ
jgi:hypothetical protein